MRFFAGVIIFLFFLIVLLFTIQQSIVGNPFRDEIHPIFIQVVFIILSFLTLLKFRRTH